MCGIFGIIGRNKSFASDLKILSKHATQRGRDSSGLMVHRKKYSIIRAEYNLEKLIEKTNFKEVDVVLGHSRLITDGAHDNQPYVTENLAVFHNGIVVNAEKLFSSEKILIVRTKMTQVLPKNVMFLAKPG